MATYAERLEKVRAAIDAVLEGGQDVTYGGKRVTFADLNRLRQLERDYEREAAREARGGGVRVRYGTPL
ncbi:MAG TPA: hypothetical protein VF188_09170 [Longimicrobiales bacterium]|jgi:phage FluMu gp28-like protein